MLGKKNTATSIVHEPLKYYYYNNMLYVPIVPMKVLLIDNNI